MNQSPAPVAAEEGRRRHSSLTNVAVNTSSCPASYFNRLGKIGILSGRRRLSSLPVFMLYKGHLSELSLRWDIINLPCEEIACQHFAGLSHSRPLSLSTMSSQNLHHSQPGRDVTQARRAMQERNGGEVSVGEMPSTPAGERFKSKSTDVTARPGPALSRVLTRSPLLFASGASGV